MKEITFKEKTEFVTAKLNKCRWNHFFADFSIRLRSLPDGTEINKIIFGDSAENLVENIYSFLINPQQSKK